MVFFEGRCHVKLILKENKDNPLTITIEYPQYNSTLKMPIDEHLFISMISTLSFRANVTG